MVVQLRGTFQHLIPPVLDIRMNGERHCESNLAAAASVQFSQNQTVLLKRHDSCRALAANTNEGNANVALASYLTINLRILGLI